MSRFNCRALLGMGPSQYFIWYGCRSSPMRRNNAVSSPAWQKQMNALLITLHSFLPRGTWSDLTDPPPLRNSTWSIRSPGRAPPPNFYTDPIAANANHFFASGTLSPPPFVGQISRWTRLVWAPLPATLSPQPLPLSRTSSRPSNWTTVNVPYVRSKLRYLQGLSRFNRGPTDLTQSSSNRQTPFWTPISRPVSFSTPRRCGRAPSCASRRNRVASESQSTTKN